MYTDQGRTYIRSWRRRSGTTKRDHPRRISPWETRHRRKWTADRDCGPSLLRSRKCDWQRHSSTGSRPCIRRNFDRCWTTADPAATIAKPQNHPNWTGYCRKHDNLCTGVGSGGYAEDLTPQLFMWRDIDITVRENVCNNSKKRKKSCFFGFWKKT